MDGWRFGFGIGAFVGALMLIILGFGLGKTSIATDCEDFGKFKEDGVFYTCARATP